MAWTSRDDLRLSIKLGLRKGFGLVRGMRRSLNDEEQDRVADAVADQLKLMNWRIEPGPPATGHGSHLMGRAEGSTDGGPENGEAKAES